MLGGIGTFTRAILQRDQVYTRFYTIIDREWSRVFSDLQGETLPLCLPRHFIPDTLGDFSTCQ